MIKHKDTCAILNTTDLLERYETTEISVDKAKREGEGEGERGRERNRKRKRERGRKRARYILVPALYLSILDNIALEINKGSWIRI